jgi:hypothetical protein
VKSSSLFFTILSYHPPLSSWSHVLQVSEVADTAVEAAHEIGDKAQDVADATKRTVSQAVTKASQALESEEARLK